MSFNRTLPLSKQLFNCKKRDLVPVFKCVTKTPNIDKVQFYREFFSNSNTLWIKNHSSPFIEIRRYRYSFVYSKKPFSIINSRLSSLNNNKNIGAMNFNETPLTKPQADELVLRLTEEERKALFSALQEFDSNRVKAEYEGIKIYSLPNNVTFKILQISLLPRNPKCTEKKFFLNSNSALY